MFLIADFPNPEDRAITESSYRNVFEQSGLSLQTASTLSLDLIHASDEEIVKVLDSAGIEGVLIISLSTFQYDELPRDSLLALSSTKTQIPWRKAVAFAMNPSEEYPRLQNSLATPSLSVTTRLYNVSSGPAEWLAATSTEGGGIGTLAGVVSSQAEALVRELQTDGYLIAGN